MTRYALIVGGVVANIVEQDSLPAIAGQWVACGNAGPGWVYSGGAFSAPEQAPAPRFVARYSFLSRFTDAEAVAIDLASMGATVEAATMRRYLAKVSAASKIDLDLADTRAGVQALETAGLIAVGRAAQILDAPVLDGERP